MIRTVITGTGSYIPKNAVSNTEFESHEFYDKDGTAIEGEGKTITDKFKSITGIQERRYADSDNNASCIGAKATKIAIEDAGIDPETNQYGVGNALGLDYFTNPQSKSVLFSAAFNF